MNGKYYTTRNRIVCGFPGVGKSVVFSTADCFGKDFIIFDSDSSKFDKTRFPENYLEHITSNIDSDTKERVIMFVSTHEAVLAGLKSLNRPFAIVIPRKDVKDSFLSRYRERGSDEKFIDLISANWDKWLDDIHEKYGNDPDVEIFELDWNEYISSIFSKLIDIH